MSQYSRNRRQRKQGSAGKKIVGVLLGVLSLIALAIGGLGLWVLNVAADAPDIDTLRPASDGANSQIFDAAGNSLGYVQSDILREPVKLKKIPKDLQEGTIAIEDSNFYEHGGVDYSAIVRAAFANAEAGEVRQGASTITQQLVRNLYIDDPKDDIERKIQEAKMAQQYEDEHSKDQILDEYLNTATYGTNRRQVRGRRPGRRRGVLRQGRPGPRPARSRRSSPDSRRRPPSTTPSRTPTMRRHAATRSSTRWPTRATSPRPRPNRSRRRASGLERGTKYDDPHPAVLLRLRPERADRQVRAEDRPPGRPQGLHDAQPDRSGRGRAGDRQRSATSPAPRERSSRPTPTPGRSSRWPPRSPTTRASSTSPPTASASRVPRSSRSS